MSEATRDESTLRQLTKQFDEIKKDTSHGGDLLSKSYSNLVDWLLTSAADDLIDAAHRLATEVLAQYRFEKALLLDQRFSLRQDRPRTSFTVLPLSDAWIKCKSRDVQLALELPVNPATEPDLDARYLKYRPSGHKDSRRGRPADASGSTLLFVLIPISNGYSHTRRSLTCLYYDVKHIAAPTHVTFYVCNNFTDDNTLDEVARFAKTLLSTSQIGLVLYNVERRTVLGTNRSPDHTIPGWSKSVVLNLMLSGIQDHVSKEQIAKDSVFLHFADDDIYVYPGSNVIANNISYLKRRPDASIISNAYVSHDDCGFLSIATVRKRPVYVGTLDRYDHCPELLNLYGGSLTTTLERLENLQAGSGQQRDRVHLPVSYSEDLHLTLMANQAHLCNQSAKPKAFARTDILVGHDECSNVLTWFARLSRDRAWLDKAAVSDTRERFKKLRKESFCSIGKAIEANGTPRDRVAHAWLGFLRDLPADPEGGPTRLKGIDWAELKSQHQICRDIVADPKVRTEVTNQARLSGLGHEFVHCLDDRPDDITRDFPQLSVMLARIDDDEVRHVRSSYLLQWHAIARESAAFVFQFLECAEPNPSQPAAEANRKNTVRQRMKLSAAVTDSLEARFRLNVPALIARSCGATNVSISSSATWNPQLGASNDARPAWRAYSYHVFVDAGERKLFARFFPVVGVGGFSFRSPDQAVYLHVLGESLARGLLAEAGDSLVTLPVTEYPTLEQATLHHAGPEPRTPTGRFLASFYIQRRISQEAKRLWMLKLTQDQCEALAQELAGFLGNQHGLSLGCRSALQDHVESLPGSQHAMASCEEDARPRIPRELFEHSDSVPFCDSRVYEKWLLNGAHRENAPSQLFQSLREGKEGLGLTVESLLRHKQQSLNEVWDSLCRESVDFHRSSGALGHLGLYSSNLFIEFVGLEARTIESTTSEYRGQVIYIAEPAWKLKAVWIPNHEGVAMIDPAIEAGWVLDEVIAARMSSSAVARNRGEEWALSAESLPRLTRSFIRKYLEKLKERLGATTPGGWFARAIGFARERGMSETDLNEVRRWVREQEAHIRSGSQKKETEGATPTSGIEFGFWGKVILATALKKRPPNGVVRFTEVFAQAGMDAFVGNQIRCVDRIERRLAQAAAMGLIMRYYNRREYNLSEDERRALTHVIMDLLHEGGDFPFVFRAGSSGRQRPL